MRFIIRGENIEVTPAIKEYVEKRVSKIQRYFDEDETIEVRVNLKVYNDAQRIEVTIPLRNNVVLRAEDRNLDLYTAIDSVVDKLERQIRKHKTKLNRKAREKGSIKYIFADRQVEVDVEESTETEDSQLDVVRKKRFGLKPMDVEEAILQMNMLGHDFFIFTNAETDETNIVYERRDGKYALIEAI